MMNRKGQFGLIVGFILALIVLAMFLFSPRLRLIIGGVALVIGSVVAILKYSDNKRLKSFIIASMFIGGLLLVFVFPQFTQSIVGSGTYVQTPTIGYYDCSPSSEAIASNWASISSSGSGFLKCPSDTDQCDFEIRAEKPSTWQNFLGNYRLVYQVCDDDGSCQNQVTIEADRWDIGGDYATLSYKNLLKSEKIYIDYQKKVLFNWNGVSGAEYRTKYKPFILWKNPGLGGRYEYSTVDQGCSFTSKERKQLVESATIQLPSQSSTNDFSLQPYKTRNYVDTFIPVSSSNIEFVEYNGKDAYCRNGLVYEIDEIVLGAGTYNIVDTSKNTKLKDGQCCPGDEEPNRVCENFEWKSIKIEDSGETNVQCSLFNPCPNSILQPKTATQLSEFKCESGRCVEYTQEVECTVNSVCASGSVCDIKTYKCIEIEISEDTENIDGELDCAWYQQESPAGSYEDCGVLGWKKAVPFVKCKTINIEGSCKTADWVYLALGSSLILILGLAFILTSPKGKKK